MSNSDVTKYMAVKTELMGRISRGQYGQGQPLPGDKGMAVEFGVSAVTARRAIQELVKEGVLVRQAGRGKGTFVRQDMNAEGKINTAEKRLRRVGFLLGQPWENLARSPVYFRLFSEVQSEFSRRGVGLEHLPVAPGGGNLMRVAREANCAAVIVIEWPDIPALVELQAGGVPVIAIGPFMVTAPISCVRDNDFLGAWTATDYLRRRGHERVAMVTPNYAHVVTSDRRAGWAMASGQITEDQELLYSYTATDGGPDPVAAILTEQFRQRPPPTAIFAFDGVNAAATVKALNAIGLSCPQDVEIVCIRRDFETMWTMPKMTAAEIREGSLGGTVFRLAEDFVSGRQSFPVVIELPMQIALGETTRQ